jgi:hypothetical protein
MIKIKDFKLQSGKKILFYFNDGTEKTIDFSPFIREDSLSKPLSDPSFFKQVELIENGRGIFWPNDFDFCPDFLYKYQMKNEVNLEEKV